MTLDISRGRRVREGDLAVVVGAGRSGRAATELLLRQKARVRLLERNAGALEPEELSALKTKGVEVRLGEHSADDFTGAAFVVPSPGMPVISLASYLPAGKCAPEVIAEMELAWRYLDAEPVIAVTGTSGKTTTASLAASMLQAQGYSVFLGGNIGTPLSEYVLSGRKADALVIEISSFQLQACSTFCPRVAILLNISPNHLDYHKDMAEYTEAKFRLFRCQDENDLAVIGRDLEPVAARYGIKARKVWIDGAEGTFSRCGLLGGHNLFNAEAAWQACRFFGVSRENAARAVADFKPLPNRLEKVREHRGVLYVNDSKCTTVSALEVALKAFDRPVRLLCGGKCKGGDLEALIPLVREKVREVALFGASREHFEGAWKGVVPISWYANMEGAVRKLAEGAMPGDVVLLAPATASFDLYKNYVARGNDFKAIVGGLA